jgi:uncharacterized protein (DUF1501 family)
MSAPRSYLSRRQVLDASVATLGLGLASSWSIPSAHAGGKAPDKLIFLLLRGGADALSILVPHGDDAYHRARPRTAIAPPGAGADATVDVDGYFGLHPRLAPLKPLFDRGELGAVVAVGPATRIRSHPAARLAVSRCIAKAAGPSRAPTAPLALDDDELVRVARWIRDDPKPGAAILESHGWDTHLAQGTGAGGRLSKRLHELTTTLLCLREAMAGEMQRTAVVVISEFGRSLHETPMGGTDDGHASALLYLGGATPGGHIVGSWPGLHEGALSEGRHLTPTVSLDAALTAVVGNREA